MHNEARTIDQTLDSVFAQRYDGTISAIVCAHDCTDQTEDLIVQGMARYSSLSLISSSQKGRPAAWNRMRTAANTQYVCFADGDVLLHPDAVRSLYEEMQKQRLLGAGALDIPLLEGTSFGTRLMAQPAGNKGSMVGRL